MSHKGIRKNGVLRFAFILLLLHIFHQSPAQLTSQIAPVSQIISGEVAGGHIFITQATLDSAGPYPSALSMMDSSGNPVFFKPFAKKTSGPYGSVLISDFKLQPSGLMSYARRKQNGEVLLYLLDSNFILVDSISCANNTRTDGHDFIHLEDGSYHLLGMEDRILDLSGMETNSGEAGSEQAVVTGNVVQRFDAEKNLVYEWHSLDHFAIEDVYSQYFTDPEELDHSHCNSLEIDTDGNYILSFRHLHEVTRIDASTGEMIWRFGGKKNQFSFTGDTMKFSAQHDARRIQNGNISIFDNGVYNSTPMARAIVYELNTDDMSAKSVWQFREPNGISSSFIGNANHLPNDNMLINWGGAFPLSVSTSFIEVDVTGEIVMELDFIPDRYISYRALKHTLPFSVHRPIISCEEMTKTLTAPAGFSSYHWNTGDISRSIVIQDTGTYQVWVNEGIGFISSKEYHISDLENMCQPTAIIENWDTDITVFPNPVFENLSIKLPERLVASIQIYNVDGTEVYSTETNLENTDSIHTLNIGHLPAGIYLIRVGSKCNKFIKF